MSDQIAPFVGASARNVVFQFSAEAITPKLLIIGTGDPTTEATNPLNSPQRVRSPEEAGDKTGFGFMIHRLVKKAAENARGVEMYYIQQAEPSGGDQSEGSINFATSANVKAGTFPLYIAGDSVPVAITDGMTPQQIATAVVAAVTNNTDLPVTAAVDETADTQVNFTAKSEGEYWGNNISLAIAIKGETIPSGINTAIVAMTAGAGTADISAALTALGVGDDANEDFYTRVIASGYGTAGTVLDSISTYNGVGNEAVGCWSKLVHRPFMNRCGDVAAGSAGLTAVMALGNGRRELDRTNGIVSVPGSRTHPAEIAAAAQGALAFLDGTPEKSVAYTPLLGVDPGEKADRWTAQQSDRNAAALAGVSVTQVVAGVVQIHTDENFYHPVSVPIKNNGYRSGRTVNIVRNTLHNDAASFRTETWRNAYITTDAGRVGNARAREKARDIGSVRDQLVGNLTSYYNLGWLFDLDFPLDELKKAGSIRLREAGNGFDFTIRFVVSGQLDILDELTEFDVAATIFTGGSV